MAPTVVHNKVLVGDSGGEFDVRGWLAALDTGSGKILWQAYNTGPDKDVLIDSRFKPFYASDKGTDLGVKNVAARRVAGWRRLGYGVFLHMIRRATCCTMAPPIPASGILKFGPVTTNGRPACGRAMPTRAQPRVLPDVAA
jgi:hypothetical protein